MAKNETAAAKKKRVKKQLSEFRKPAVFDFGRQLAEDKLKRQVRKSTPPVIRLELDPEKGAEVRPLPGMATVFFGPSGSPMMKKLFAAYGSGDIDKMIELADPVGDALTNKLLTFKEGTEDMLSKDTYFDVRYGGMTLAPNLGIFGDMSIGLILLPYNGGRLEDSDFSIVEYVKPNAKDQIEAFIVLRPPNLTELERSVLSAVPADKLEMNIAPTPMASTMVTVLLVVALTTAGNCCLQRRVGDFSGITLAKSTVTSLGPAASAREMLHARANMLSDIEHGIF